jgi:arginase
LKPYSEIRIILTDGRDLDPGEREALNNSSIVHLAEATTLLEHPLLGSPMYIHFDTDIINPEDAPAMNYPAPGGPSAEELKHVFQHIAQRGQVLAASMSTWNPELDKDGRSREVCMELFEILLGND